MTRLTNIQINADPAVLRLDDDRIFEYPFLYMLEMGRGGGPDFSETGPDTPGVLPGREGFLPKLCTT